MYKPKERAQKLIEEALDDIDVANETFHNDHQSTFIMLESIAKSIASIALILNDGTIHTDTHNKERS